MLAFRCPEASADGDDIDTRVNERRGVRVTQHMEAHPRRPLSVNQPEPISADGIWFDMFAVNGAKHECRRTALA
jgi:hypothetical protein